MRMHLGRIEDIMARIRVTHAEHFGGSGEGVMDLPVNGFKRALAARRPQIGFWCTLPGGYAAEMLAGAGFDWLLFDTEHSPADPITVLAQLQAAAPYDVASVVRAAWNDTVLIKRFLDVGAQTLLVPYVQSAAEARAAVAAIRYPPRGVRGVSGSSRATRFGRVADYATRAEAELCLLVQVETAEALGEIEAIAAVDGVDGIFVGPADLAASLGHAGRPGAPGGGGRGRGRDHADRAGRQAGRHPDPRPRLRPALPRARGALRRRRPRRRAPRPRRRSAGAGVQGLECSITQ